METNNIFLQRDMQRDIEKSITATKPYYKLLARIVSLKRPIVSIVNDELIFGYGEKSDIEIELEKKIKDLEDYYLGYYKKMNMIL